jgi:hypothetical protein
MRKLRIGYSPMSRDLKSPGDRRRVVYWANQRGHELVTDLSKKVDVIIVSENSNFKKILSIKKKTPIILDLIDGYLAENNFFVDYLHSLSRKNISNFLNPPKLFSSEIKNFCIESKAVVCSSYEQRELITKYNSNIHIILDSHEEIPVLNPRKYIKSNKILWEGLPVTIYNINQISSVLKNISFDINLELEFLTDKEYFRYGNRFFKKDTLTMLKKDLKGFSGQIRVLPWTVNNLIYASKGSKLAVIPLNLNLAMNKFKPENKLLIMWRLGLPCLVSPNTSYMRIAKNLDLDNVCYNASDWMKKIQRYLIDPDFAFFEACKGQNYVIEQHSKNVILAKWDSLLESVIS